MERKEVEMRDKIKLNDIADDLLILNKYTIDELFKIDNPTNCIALYLFYYKTAKWQKTDTIKATDLYVKKSLNWGIDKVKRTKQLLKEHGLIDVVQRRNNGKIEGWYVKVSYLVSRKKIEDIKVQVDESKNTCELQLGFSTSGSQDTNALKQQLNALKLENEMLKKQIKENNKKKVNKKQLEQEFEEIWKLYPNKKGKKDSLAKYIRARKSGVEFDTVKSGVEKYFEYCKSIKDKQYIKHGSTWFNQECWNDEYDIPERYKPNWDLSDVEFGIHTRNDEE